MAHVADLHGDGVEARLWTGEVLDQAHGPGHGLGGALHFFEAGILEPVRVEHHPQHLGEVVARLEIGVFHLFDSFHVPWRSSLPSWNLGLVGHEEVIQVAGDEPAGGGLFHDDIDDIFAIEIARLTLERLLSVVVVGGVEGELRFEAAVRVPRNSVGDGPAGECLGACLHVVLRIIGLAVHANAHCEQLQEFPPEVLVDGVLVAHAVVQIEHHGRVNGKGQQQFGETAHPQFPEHVQLLLYLAAVLALGVADAKDAVPEEGHLLLQRALSVDHAVGEISLVDFQGVHLFPVDEIALQDVHLQVRLLHRAEQFVHHGLVALGGVLFQFFVGGAETGATH